MITGYNWKLYNVQGEAIVLHTLFSIVLGRTWLGERNLQTGDGFSIQRRKFERVSRSNMIDATLQQRG
ncbi:hypothetical protein [Bradyrhizobium sp. cf659]|uniref:hypothetical protein n=1 Tax=Bradyrhizobium sp. cf659 TaxID=1761771 RepID=UPI0015A6E8AB|nr:hypothetical protein [Bradyrhizobium sp. cf659]